MKCTPGLKMMAAECGITDTLESMLRSNLDEIEVLRFITDEYRKHIEHQRAENVQAIIQDQVKSIGDRIAQDTEFMKAFSEIQDEGQARELISSRIASEEACIRKSLELPIRLIRQGHRSVFIP